MRGRRPGETGDPAALPWPEAAGTAARRADELTEQTDLPTGVCTSSPLT